jgi:hypothetical protein
MSMQVSGIARSYGRCMFSFLRSLHIVFQSGCTSLHSHQQGMRVLFWQNSHQHLLLFVFLLVVIQTGEKWNLSVALICISFMARDSKHFFMCFLAIWTFSFEKVPFSAVAHYIIGSWIF